jgi:hypothetical protein
MLECGCEGTEQGEERDGCRCLSNALVHAAKGKSGRQGGLGVGVAWRVGTGKKMGPGRAGGLLGQAASAPSRRARVAALPHDNGWRRGAGEAARH